MSREFWQLVQGLYCYRLVVMITDEKEAEIAIWYEINRL